MFMQTITNRVTLRQRRNIHKLLSKSEREKKNWQERKIRETSFKWIKNSCEITFKNIVLNEEKNRCHCREVDQLTLANVSNTCCQEKPPSFTVM